MPVNDRIEAATVKLEAEVIEINTETDTLEADTAKLNQFINGADDETVTTDNGEVDTIAKIAKEAAERIPSGGSSTFLGDTDTPNDYTDQAGKILEVNTDEDALIFVDKPSGGGTTEIASQSEVDAGDNNTKAVSPKTLKDGFGNRLCETLEDTDIIDCTPSGSKFFDLSTYDSTLSAGTREIRITIPADSGWPASIVQVRIRLEEITENFSQLRLVFDTDANQMAFCR